VINEKIAREKILELGIKVTPEQVDAAIEKIKIDNKLTHEDLLAELQRGGLNYEQYRENVKKDLERFRLINTEVKSKIIIRDEQIDEYYEKNKQQFSSRGTVRISGIFLMKKNPQDEKETEELITKGEEILAKLHEGEDFGELAIVRGKSHAGILRLVNFSARRQATVCARVIARYGKELQAGAIVTAEPGKVRIRPARSDGSDN